MINYKQLKEDVSLQTVLAHYKLYFHSVKNGDEYTGVCPFCGGNSFKANYTKNVFKCFAPLCKAKGNILDFVSHKEDVTIKRASEIIHERHCKKASKWSLKKLLSF